MNSFRCWDRNTNMERKCVGVISLMGSRALTSVVLMALWLLHPSVQFTLVHIPSARRAGLPRDQDAISAPGTLVTADNTPPPSIQASPLLLRQHPHTAPDASPSSQPPLPIPPAGAHTANSRKTNRGGENFRTSHRLGETPTESLREARNAEGVVKGKKREEGSTGLKGSQHKQAVTGGGSISSTKRRQQHHHVSDNNKSHGEALHNQDIPFTEVVQVELDSASETKDRFHAQADRTNGGGGGDVNSEPESVQVGRTNPEASAVVVLVEAEQQSLQQQQAVSHRTADPHVSKMVLTAIGSLTAILGVCVMAAIFQCCCRRKRGRSPEGREEEEKEEEEEAKKGLKQNCSSHQDSARSSKSPSPHKGATKEEEEAERGQSEKDSLLDENKKDAGEDEDLGDFSVVQRETSILRSYRKPPPPKNRARASRVPRALKTVEPNASPSVFQELVDKEKTDNNTRETPQKATNGFTSSDTVSSDMQSSMLADIDSTLAAMHNTPDSSPSRSADRSRETSIEKTTPSKTSSDDSQLKSPAKLSIPASPSKEQLAKALAQELTRSTSKEMLAKPQSKSSTPKSSKETTPKSQSAGASPKTGHGKNLSGGSSKDSVGGPNSDGANSDSRSGPSPEEGDKKKPGNIFALIDPTTKEKGEDAGSKSKIPVRAASSPTQPTAPLRLSSGKDKRFPVPSVHGDQLDQLMKSLKTRLKEDDGEGSKQVSNTVSSEEKPAQDDDLDPTGRDRSHSDPTKKQEGKGKKMHQTHL